MRIVICGGGGLGHTCSAMLSTREGVIVDLLTNHPEKWNHTFTVNAPDKGAITGRLHTISSNPADVIPNADWVIFCLPAFLVEENILKIKSYLTPEKTLGCIVAYTGFFFFAHNHLPANTKLFGLQRVPYISRVVEYGKEANLLGYRDQLIAATENIDDLIDRYSRELKG